MVDRGCASLDHLPPGEPLRVLIRPKRATPRTASPRCPPKRHDSGAVPARYRHAFGGLSVRFLVGQSVRNPADSAEFSAYGRPALAHLFLDASVWASGRSFGSHLSCLRVRLLDGKARCMRAPRSGEAECAMPALRPYPSERGPRFGGLFFASFPDVALLPRAGASTRFARPWAPG